jgi:3-dehydroquinate synthase
MSASPPPRSLQAVRLGLFVIVVATLVCLPFVIWGEDPAQALLASQEGRKGGLVVLGVLLLAADAVAPVPATLVIMLLGSQAGFVGGLIGGTLGLTAGVVMAAWVGRHAVGRVAPRVLSESELARVRNALATRLGLTLACLRSIPVLAETSVILAAAAGIPLRRIVWATVLPNLAVSLIYSAAADDSFATAVIAFLATVAASGLLWLIARRSPGEVE